MKLFISTSLLNMWGNSTWLVPILDGELNFIAYSDKEAIRDILIYNGIKYRVTPIIGTSSSYYELIKENE